MSTPTQATDRPLTPSQVAVLGMVDEHGATFVSNRTHLRANTANSLVVRSLVGRGLLETFLAGDGQYARRPAPVVTETEDNEGLGWVGRHWDKLLAGAADGLNLATPGGREMFRAQVHALIRQHQPRPDVLRALAARLNGDCDHPRATVRGPRAALAQAWIGKHLRWRATVMVYAYVEATRGRGRVGRRAMLEAAASGAIKAYANFTGVDPVVAMSALVADADAALAS